MHLNIFPVDDDSTKCRRMMNTLPNEMKKIKTKNTVTECLHKCLMITVLCVSVSSSAAHFDLYIFMCFIFAVCSLGIYYVCACVPLCRSRFAERQ